MHIIKDKGRGKLVIFKKKGQGNTMYKKLVLYNVVHNLWGYGQFCLDHIAASIYGERKNHRGGGVSRGRG